MPAQNFLVKLFILIEDLYNWYIKTVDNRSAIIALVISAAISLAILIDFVPSKKRALYTICENRFVSIIFPIVLDIFIFCNISKLFSGYLPLKIASIHILYAVIIIIIFKWMLISILNYITNKSRSITRDLVLVIGLLVIYVGINNSLLPAIIISLIYLTIMNNAIKIRSFLTKSMVGKYGLMYSKDEYTSLMEKVQIQDDLNDMI